MKIPATFLLKAVNTNKTKKFTVLSRLQMEIELTITKPVQISHPTNFILLPLTNPPEQWSTSAVGGSGVYDWSVQDP